MSVDFFGIGGPGQIGNIKKPDKPQGNKKAESAQGNDQVQFSSVLQDVNKAQEAKESNSSERAERVQELKAQIAEGSYQPDLNKVATSLLEFLMKEK